MLLHGGVVDAQELVGGGHHVDAVRLTLGTFLIHELVHRIWTAGYAPAQPHV